MKTIEMMLRQMTDASSIIQDLRDTLRTIDPQFPAAEQSFNKAVAALEQSLGDAITPTVSEYLAAKEEVLAMELIYIGWQGFQLNLEIFKNPVNALLLQGDYEDLNLERRLETLPTAKKARAVQCAFHEAMQDMPDEAKDLTDGVEEFYTYLETAGYKIAHYFGFRLADRFLTFVVPGYISDQVNTIQYSGGLQRYLKIDLDRME